MSAFGPPPSPPFVQASFLNGPLEEAVFVEGELPSCRPDHVPGVPGGPGAVAMHLLRPQRDPLDVLHEVGAALVMPRQDLVDLRRSSVRRVRAPVLPP